jgi:hypothetical protein
MISGLGPPGSPSGPRGSLKPRKAGRKIDVSWASQKYSTKVAEASLLQPRRTRGLS